MTELRAEITRTIVATAGLAPADMPGLDTLPGNPRGASLFEWLAFNSGLQGIIVDGPDESFGCCYNGAIRTPRGYTGPSAGLLGKIAHEVRHLQKAHNCQVELPDGRKVWRDSAFAEQGAYGVHVKVLSALGKSPALSNQDKDYATLSAEGMRRDMFCAEN